MPETPGARAPYLHIVNVRKTFGSLVALEDIDLHVFEGEFICFLGPSGCGKTTLLRIIAGLESPDNGQIIQAGQDVTSWPPSERDFGIVFQSYALFPNMTAERNIAYGLESTGQPRAEIRRRVRDLLELVGLERFARQYPSKLSGGQQQRVALARALALSPSLLLLDEPLSALDARVRANLRREISQLQRKLGVTTIMVTHDQEEALTMGDRIVVMDQGHIVQVGTPFEVYRQPQTPFVANFVGVTNLLQARLTGEPRGLAVNGMMLPLPEEDGGLSSAAEGTPVTVAIRPEDVLFSPERRKGHYPVQVVHAEFLGSFYRLTLRPEGPHGPVLVADVSASSADALSRLVEQRVDGVAGYMHIPSAALRAFAHGDASEHTL